MTFNAEKHSCGLINQSIKGISEIVDVITGVHKVLFDIILICRLVLTSR